MRYSIYVEDESMSFGVGECVASSASGELVEHVYDQTVQYAHHEVRYSNQYGRTLCSASQPSKQVFRQAVLQIPQRDLSTLVKEKLLTDVDRRHRVHKVLYPHTIHVQLEMDFQRGSGTAQYSGSGALVGPNHILTCGHNVYHEVEDHQPWKWAAMIRAFPARNGYSAPFGMAIVTRVYVFSQWVEKHDANYDIALLVLDCAKGWLTGWAGLLCTTDQDLLQEDVQVTGYPGDKGFGQMWEMRDKVKSVTDEKFQYEIDTYYGQSGSAVWVNRFGLPTIIGVHTNLAADCNEGVRLSKAKFEQFIRVIANTYKIQLPPCKVDQFQFGRCYQLVVCVNDKEMALCLKTKSIFGIPKNSRGSHSDWVHVVPLDTSDEPITTWSFEHSPEEGLVHIKTDKKVGEVFLSAHLMNPAFLGTDDIRDDDSHWVHAREKDEWVREKAPSSSRWSLERVEDGKFRITLLIDGIARRFLSAEDGDRDRCDSNSYYAHVREVDAESIAQPNLLWELREASA